MPSSPSDLPTFPHAAAFFDGHIRNEMGIFGVHYGDPRFLLDIPSPATATAPAGYDFREQDFRRPRWINPVFAYLVLLPRYNPFYGPIFSRLNVDAKRLPIVQVSGVNSSYQATVYWGLKRSFIDRWLDLESLLRLTLTTMRKIYGGDLSAQGVHSFALPICFRYTERNARTRSQAVEFALHSRDAFLPLMAQITLMFILLDSRPSSYSPADDWRATMLKQTRLHPQWMVDLENSAVGDMSIDRLGGIIDLTRARDQPNQRLPRDAAWLFPHLLGKHRVPLLFFYGQEFPPEQRLPQALVDSGLLPNEEEVRYLRSLPGDIVFSQWVHEGSLWRSRRGDARSAPTARASAVPSAFAACRPSLPSDADPSLPAVSVPAVERDSGQLPGETIHAFLARRRLHNEQRAQHESSDAKQRRLAREAHAAKGQAPGKKGARVFIWEEEQGFFIRRAYNRVNAEASWDDFTANQRVYDSFSNQWDLCTALAPEEEAELDDDDDDYNNNAGGFDATGLFHLPSVVNGFPSIPDVPGRERLEQETGAGAEQDLQQAYGLDRDDLREDTDVLAGWRAPDLQEIVFERFGFEEPSVPPVSTEQLPELSCAWALGDETWKNTKNSALPTLLQLILVKNLNEIPGDLLDLANPHSHLADEWAVDVKVSIVEKRKLYEVRPCRTDASSPSILLERAATVLQIIRSGLADAHSIIKHLVRLGVEFYPGWSRPVHYTALSPPPIYALGNRPVGYVPTLVDFGVYVERRNAFLRTPRGHAALFHGGIVSRLARMVIVDAEDLACLEPSEEFLKSGKYLGDGNGPGVWHETLSAGELNLICGVYPVETGQKSSKEEDGQQMKYISWWPTPTAFWSSGLNTGWWNANSERWFVKRLKEIENGQAKLYKYAEWKNKMRFSTAARKVAMKNDSIAAEFLANLAE